MQCLVPDCTTDAYVRDVCRKHDYRMRKFGSYDTPSRKRAIRYCSIDGCERVHDGLGFCRMHRERAKVNGDPLVVRRRVATGDTPEQRFWSCVKLTANPDKCWEWEGSGVQGYGRVTWRGKKTLAHRVAMEIVNGVEPTLHVLHSCDNPPCVNPNHLREGTIQDNTRDKVEKGRQQKGTMYVTAKLTESLVREARRLRAAGMQYKDIALHINGVGETTLWKAINRQAWKHVD